MDQKALKRSEHTYTDTRKKSHTQEYDKDSETLLEGGLVPNALLFMTHTWRSWTETCKGIWHILLEPFMKKRTLNRCFSLRWRRGGVLFASCLFLRLPSPDSGMLMYVTDVCSLVSSWTIIPIYKHPYVMIREIENVKEKVGEGTPCVGDESRVAISSQALHPSRMSQLYIDFNQNPCPLTFLAFFQSVPWNLSPVPSPHVLRWFNAAPHAHAIAGLQSNSHSTMHSKRLIAQPWFYKQSLLFQRLWLFGKLSKPP